jgi:hypothetical protein
MCVVMCGAVILPDPIKRQLSEIINYGKAQRYGHTGAIHRHIYRVLLYHFLLYTIYMLTCTPCVDVCCSILFGQWGFGAQVHPS